MERAGEGASSSGMAQQGGAVQPGVEDDPHSLPPATGSCRIDEGNSVVRHGQEDQIGAAYQTGQVRGQAGAHLIGQGPAASGGAAVDGTDRIARLDGGKRQGAAGTPGANDGDRGMGREDLGRRHGCQACERPFAGSE